MKFICILFSSFLLVLSVRSASAAGMPSNGDGAPIPELDNVMMKFVRKIDCTAGALAIAKDGKILYQRGYGWLDQEHQRPAPANVCIGIASCEKPITAAAVRKLAADGKLELNKPLFSILGIQPAGKVKDPRVNEITVEHVLQHKAGWGGDIYEDLKKEAQRDGIQTPTTQDLLAQVMCQRLEADPGKVNKYSNFGFDTMRYLVGMKSGTSPGTYYREALLKQPGSQDVGQHEEVAPGQMTDRVVWNLADGGPIYASADYMVAFMHDYWLTGMPRDKSRGGGAMHGSLPASTALMVWRNDGLDVAANFNGRNQTSHSDISRELNNAVDKLISTLTGTAGTTQEPNVPESPHRVFTDIKNRKIEATIVSANRSTVTIRKGNEEFTIPLSTLIQEDRDFIKRWRVRAIR